MELTEIHPGILIVYYLILALSAFLFSNPYYMITFIVLMLFLIYLQGVRSELVNVMKIFIPLGALIIIINPLFIYKELTGYISGEAISSHWKLWCMDS